MNKTKTLNTIQTLSKIGKILCKIIFIFCLIGFIGCIVGIIGLALIPNGLNIGGTTIHGIVEKSPEISLSTCYTAMAAGVVLCAGEAVLCKIAEHYFKNELEAGTPFTFEGAKELIRLGIFTICIPIATSIISGIVCAVMTAVFGKVYDFEFGKFISIGLGIMFIISGLLCRYGAEIQAKDSHKDDINEGEQK